jgi:hypothetical protein
MRLIKYLLSSLLLPLFLFGGEEAWVPVEVSKKQVSEAEDEGETGLGTLFIKNLGDETVQIHFPGEPEYGYRPDGTLEIAAQKEGERFELVIKDQESGFFREPLEQVIQTEGKWVHETIVQSDLHQYRFKTISDTPESAHHEAFRNSFSIEKNR